MGQVEQELGLLGAVRFRNKELTLLRKGTLCKSPNP